MKSLLCLALLTLSGSLLAAPKKEPFEEAVDRGLGYLVRSQNRDGSWSAGRGGTSDPAVSALAVMAFLSSGHVPGEGPHGEVVEKGVRSVMSVQNAGGTFTPAQKGPLEMYYQGICTLMLAEVVGMMPDRFEADKLRTQLTKAVRVVLAAQRTLGEDRGGWRYAISGTDADISVTGWQIMALRAAKNVGCDVPPEAIDRAVAFVRNCFDPLSGGYRYQRSQTVTVPCTGAAILSLELCGSRYFLPPGGTSTSPWKRLTRVRGASLRRRSASGWKPLPGPPVSRRRIDPHSFSPSSRW